MKNRYGKLNQIKYTAGLFAGEAKKKDKKNNSSSGLNILNSSHYFIRYVKYH